MTGYKIIKKIGLITASIVLTACESTNFKTTPLTEPDHISKLQSVQSRIITVSSDQVFPQVIDIMMDNGFIIQSVDSSIGYFSFSKQWSETINLSPFSYRIDSSVIFKAIDKTSTEMRLVLAGTKSGATGTSNGSHFYTRPFSVEPAEYNKILDLIENGLTKGNSK